MTKLKQDQVRVKVFQMQVTHAEALGQKVDEFLKNKELVQIETHINSGDDSKYNNGSQMVITLVYKETV